MDDNLNICDGTEEDWAEVLRLAKEELHWFGTLDEYRVWKNILGGNQLKVVKDAEGNLISTVSCNIYNEELASFTWFYTRPDQRRRKIGRMLLDHACDLMGDRNIGCFGVPNMVEWYKTSRGQTYMSEFREQFYSISSVDFEAVDIADTTGITIVAAKNFNMQKLLDYQPSHILGQKFFDCWMLDYNDSESYIAVDKNGSVVGYGTIMLEWDGQRACVSPLCATDHTVASILLKQLHKEYSDKPLFLMANSGHAGMENIVKKLGANDEGWLQPMYTKSVPPLLNDVYCFTNYGIY